MALEQLEEVICFQMSANSLGFDDLKNYKTIV